MFVPAVDIDFNGYLNLKREYHIFMFCTKLSDIIISQGSIIIQKPKSKSNSKKKSNTKKQNNIQNTTQQHITTQNQIKR